MKKAHRKVHFIVWICLLPILLILSALALNGRMDSTPANQVIKAEQQGVRLP